MAKNMVEIEDLINELKEGRKAYEGVWTSAEKNLKCEIPDQYSEAGTQGNQVSMGTIWYAIMTYTRITLERIFKSKQIYDLTPIGSEDVDFTQRLEKYFNWKVKRIKSLRWQLIQCAMNNATYGNGITKFNEKPLEVLNVPRRQIWFNDACDWSRINVFYHEIELSEAELRGREIYKNKEEYIDQVKGKRIDKASSPAEKEKLAIKLNHKFKIGELWYIGKYVNNKAIWTVMTIGLSDEGVPAVLFREKEKPVTYGQPFDITCDFQTLNSLNGRGSAQVLQDIEYALNMTVNLNLNYLQMMMRPPFLYTDDLLHETTADLDRLVYRELGGGIPVNSLDAVKYLDPPRIDPSHFQTTGFLMNEAHEKVGLPKLLSGGAGESREPFRTTSGRWEKASGMMDYKNDNFFEQLLKPIGHKILMCIFADPPINEIMRIMGKEGQELFQVTSGEENQYIPPRPVNPNQPPSQENPMQISQLVIKKSALEDITELYDIEINPYTGQDFLLIDSLLKNLPQFFAMAPEVRTKIKIQKLLMKLLEPLGVEAKDILNTPQEELQEMTKLQQMAQTQQPQQQGQERM